MEYPGKNRCLATTGTIYQRFKSKESGQSFVVMGWFEFAAKAGRQQAKEFLAMLFLFQYLFFYEFNTNKVWLVCRSPFLCISAILY